MIFLIIYVPLTAVFPPPDHNSYTIQTHKAILNNSSETTSGPYLVFLDVRWFKSISCGVP